MRPALKKIIKMTSAVSGLLLALVLLFAYVRYQELKKTLIDRISGKASSFAGQKVEIEDFSFSPSAGINIYNIVIKNPDYYAPGELLKIKKIFLKLRYRALFNRKLHFEDIVIYGPELKITEDDKGRLNISEKLKEFFRKEPSLKYHINEFVIESGLIGFNRDEIYRISNINLRLKELSSYAGIKTLISGSASYAGSRASLDGWAYLKDEPVSLNIGISSKDFTPGPLKELLSLYGISTEKTEISFQLIAEGDTGKGILLKSEIAVKEAGLKFFRREAGEILLDIRAFLNIPDNSITLENISLRSGDITSAVLKGEIKRVNEDLLYKAALKIGRLDLAAFSFMEDMKISGIVTSGDISLNGSLKKEIPEISGFIQLSDGAFSSQYTNIRNINARLTFTPVKGRTLRAEAAAQILKVRGYVFDKPAEADIQMTAAGDISNAEMLSSVSLAPVSIPINGAKKFEVENLDLSVKGNMRQKALSGEIQAKIKGIQYDTYNIPWLRGASNLACSRNIAKFQALSVRGENFMISAKELTATLPEKKTAGSIKIKMDDMNAAYPERTVEVAKTTVSLNLNTRGKALSGDILFSIGESRFEGIRTGLIQGRVTFDERYFTADIPVAEISGGSIKIYTKGRSARGPFPMTVTTSAVNINLAGLLQSPVKIGEDTYTISGNLARAAFEGTISSAESLQGRAEIEAEKISAINRDKKNIMHGASLKGEATFDGNDLDFSSQFVAGKISAGISGRVTGFIRKDRIMKARVVQPEVDIPDIRDTFWDIFPDALLYAGLEGSISSDVTVESAGSEMKVRGAVSLKNVLLHGEYDEFAVGPVNGIIPVAYEKTGRQMKEIQMRVFERRDFEKLVNEYSRRTFDDRHHKITIGSLRYGFELMDDLTLWVEEKGGVLNVDRFSGKIFGGSLNGSAAVGISNGISYRAGFLVEGMSLTELCDGIEPIKGYISGKVNAVGNIKGSGAGTADLIGKADIWTYSTRDEKTKISKEFLKKMGGPSVKAYLGDRKFDKGEMIVYLQNGYFIFEELEISNRNIFGVRDLSIKVAPHSNRIAIDHLMWSIVEAAGRAKEK
jgi:hypothetical protein